ncbi:MAG: stimulus-sensing domain-containing protein [Pseudomonadota bacterium]
MNVLKSTALPVEAGLEAHNDSALPTRGRRPMVGLDDRPRPASTRERIVRGLKQSAPFSSLQRRIIFFNLAGLAFLVAGAMYLNQFRSGLIEQRLDSLKTLGRVNAITVAERAVLDPSAAGYDPASANAALNRLADTAGLRARLYDRRLRLIGDTRASVSGPAGETAADALADSSAIDSLFDRIERLYGGFERSLHTENGIVYDPNTDTGIARDQGVREAAEGGVNSAVRINTADQLIVSIAVPVYRAEAIIGVLVLSTEGDDINKIVRAERAAILQVFLVAAIVSTGLSILLANTIAMPIRKLAAAADSEGVNSARPLSPERAEIPDMSRRTDEIGELSSALIRMTDALYKRIHAIESFASDVAHEIKNPLTSLRSAVETMEYARTPEQRQRLMDVIQKDVSRMDRLVTDISNASRLDADLVRERMEDFDLGSLLEMLSQVFATQGEKRGVHVTLDLPEGRLGARGLEGRIAQVVTNFLDNALSFSPEGSTVALKAIERPGGGVRVSVSDHGPGVPPDNIESVFERFYTERPESEGFGNHSGLGLAISRQIVEAHGGRIWVENILDPAAGPEAAPLGARFIFDLPE